jgi:hypothetical protein
MLIDCCCVVGKYSGARGGMASLGGWLYEAANRVE